MEQSKYTTIFASNSIKCITSEEKDKFLALASLESLKAFIPEIDLAKDIDLLPIAFDACVANRVNKNGDIIDTETAVAIYKRFIRRFIDTEHNRTKIVGVIVGAFLSEFGSNKILTEADVLGKSNPFNITLGAVIWKAVNNDLCDLIEDSNDPTSPNYMDVSASWELGFSDYRIIELEQGQKNLVNPIEIGGEEDKEKIKKYLKCFGGSGVKDGRCYYRMPCQDVIPMGIGLTEKPAADVSGIATIVTPEQDKTEAQSALSKVIIQDSISQTNNLDVKIERINIMKINSIADITDESLKQCTASVISDFISSEIKKASDEFAKASADDKDNTKRLQDQHNELSKNVSEMRATIETLQKEKEGREGIDRFNRHMNEVHAEYDMPSDVASVVAEQIKAASNDEIFAKWKAGAGVLLKPYNRKDKAAKADEEAEAQMKGGPKDSPKNQPVNHKSSTHFGPDNDKENDSKKNIAPVQASMTDGPKDGSKDENSKKKSSTKSGPEDDKETDKKSKAAIASAVEDALDNGSPEKGGLPNGTSAASPSLKQRFAQSFAVENFIIT